ncbi:hypothetical protein [uncultured Nostoc sp.]|uniref:hypothetical protein n=1 Tax=uncultured Nostoc sp. TaxID=340711 RepID=UPI00260D3D7F|nr:hypothetical protein [uncultured Nostoc sp.]
MIESTLFTPLSTNEEANLSGGGKKSGGNKTVIIVGEVGNTKYGNTNTAIGSGDANYYDHSNKPKKHH